MATATACVADTSWLYALLNARDEFHAVAVAQAESKESIYIPPVILAETLLLVQRRGEKLGRNGHALAVEAMDRLAAKPSVLMAEPDHDHDATSRILRAHPRLTYPDAAAVAAARRKAVPLCTFDEAQRQAHASARP